MKEHQAFTRYKAKLKQYQSKDCDNIILNPAEFVFFVLDRQAPPIDRHTFSIRNDFNQTYLKTLLREFDETTEARVLPRRLAETMSTLTGIDISSWQKSAYTSGDAKQVTVTLKEHTATSRRPPMSQLTSAALAVLVDTNSHQWKPNTFFINNHGKFHDKWAPIARCCDNLSPEYIVTWLCETPPSNDPLRSLRLEFIEMARLQVRAAEPLALAR